MKPWQVGPKGRFEQQTITSRALAGNPLDAPAERPLWVYLPPGYGDDPDRRYPSIYVLQGLTGQVDMWWSRSAFRPTTPERIDELFAGGTVPPAVVVLIDAWTSLGGSQYLNSPGTGRYLDYLCDEIVPFVDERYATLPSREHRGVTGKSSGGYGAMVVPMLRPDVFGALASHAGDALFELCYLPDVAPAVRALRDEYDGSFEKFWADFRSRPAGGSATTCGGAGRRWTRCAWSPGTPTLWARCAGSTWTPARATSGTWTSAPPPSPRSWTGSASRTPSSWSTPATARSSTATRSPSGSWRSACAHSPPQRSEARSSIDRGASFIGPPNPPMRTRQLAYRWRPRRAASVGRRPGEGDRHPGVAEAAQHALQRGAGVLLRSHDQVALLRGGLDPPVGELVELALAVGVVGDDRAQPVEDAPFPRGHVARVRVDAHLAEGGLRQGDLGAAPVLGHLDRALVDPREVHLGVDTAGGDEQRPLALDERRHEAGVLLQVDDQLEVGGRGLVDAQVLQRQQQGRLAAVDRPGAEGIGQRRPPGGEAQQRDRDQRDHQHQRARADEQTGEPAPRARGCGRRALLAAASRVPPGRRSSVRTGFHASTCTRLDWRPCAIDGLAPPTLRSARSAWRWEPGPAAARRVRTTRSSTCCGGRSTSASPSSIWRTPAAATVVASGWPARRSAATAIASPSPPPSATGRWTRWSRPPAASAAGTTGRSSGRPGRSMGRCRGWEWSRSTSGSSTIRTCGRWSRTSSSTSWSSRSSGARSAPTGSRSARAPAGSTRAPPPSASAGPPAPGRCSRCSSRIPAASWPRSRPRRAPAWWCARRSTPARPILASSTSIS